MQRRIELWTTHFHREQHEARAFVPASGPVRLGADGRVVGTWQLTTSGAGDAALAVECLGTDRPAPIQIGLPSVGSGVAWGLMDTTLRSGEWVRFGFLSHNVPTEPDGNFRCEGMLLVELPDAPVDGEER